MIEDRIRTLEEKVEELEEALKWSGILKAYSEESEEHAQERLQLRYRNDDLEAEVADLKRKLEKARRPRPPKPAEETDDQIRERARAIIRGDY